MKRTTITIPDELRDALDAYIQRQEEPLELSTVVEKALREFLERQEQVENVPIRPFRITPIEEIDEGDNPEHQPFKITPATKGGGLSDVSVNHDKYFAEMSYKDNVYKV